jgi:hypothetical protein
MIMKAISTIGMFVSMVGAICVFIYCIAGDKADNYTEEEREMLRRIEYRGR